MSQPTGTNLYQSLKEDLNKLLYENVLSVNFKKKDGSDRTMLCTLKAEHLPVIKKQEDDEARKDEKQSDTSIVVWDLEKKGWRSFRIDSLVSHTISSL
jgi:hypothetical protein